MRDLFQKHQNLLLKLVNNPYGRGFLNLSQADKNKKILQVTPNSLLQIEKERKHSTQYRRIIYCGSTPRFAKKLALALDSVDLVGDTFSKYKKDLRSLMHYLGFKHDFSYPLIMHANRTFNSGSGDGSIYVNPNATWAGAYGATVGDGVQGTLMQNVASNDGADPRYSVIRGFVATDVSALETDTTSIDAVLFKPYIISTSFQNADTTSLDVVATTEATANSLVVEDFDQTTTTKYATSIALASLNQDAYNTFTFNATGIAAVDALIDSDWLKFGTRLARDTDNSSPTGLNEVQYQLSHHANPPILDVTYTRPSTATGNFSFI